MPIVILTVFGIFLVLSAFSIWAFQPYSAVDTRPNIVAQFSPATPTLHPSPTLTQSPTATRVAIATASSLPSVTPIPSATYTPTPLPTPDGFERDFIIPILMYHYVSVPPSDADIYRIDLSIAPEAFQQQMQWLKDNGYTAISLYDLVYALTIGWPPLPEKPIILTFDDGYEDNYQNAYPILVENGLSGTFFILTDVTDRRQPGYMTWDMLKEMSENGMDIEVHGREHIEYSGRDYDWLVYHLLGPQQTIEANLGYIPRFIAYPSGRYDAFTIEVGHELGYWAGITTINGAEHLNSNLFELRRIRVKGDWTIDTFDAVISANTMR